MAQISIIFETADLEAPLVLQPWQSLVLFWQHNCCSAWVLIESPCSADRYNETGENGQEVGNWVEIMPYRTFNLSILLISQTCRNLSIRSAALPREIALVNRALCWKVVALTVINHNASVSEAFKKVFLHSNPLYFEKGRRKKAGVRYK